MIQVLVKRPNDGTLVFQVDRLNRVSELKQMIEERSGVAPELQLLQFGEKQYEDEVTIEDIYKSGCFQDNEVPVLMLVRLRGGVNIVHHQRHYHEDLRKGVAQSWISSGDGAGGSSYLCQSDSGDGADGSSYLCQSDSGDGADGSSYLRQSDSGDGADGSSYLRQSDSDEEDLEDPFNIADTENVPAELLKRWRVMAILLMLFLASGYGDECLYSCSCSCSCSEPLYFIFEERRKRDNKEENRSTCTSYGSLAYVLSGFLVLPGSNHFQRGWRGFYGVSVLLM